MPTLIFLVLVAVGVAIIVCAFLDWLMHGYTPAQHADEPDIW